MAKTDEVAPGAHAFLLCELEWMRRRLLSRLACEELTAFTDELGEGGAGDVDEDLVERARTAVEEIEELVISVGHQLAALPAGSVRATPEEVEVAAAAALEDGIADAERAMHAARWIGVEAGARALWMLLSYGDAFRFWQVQVPRFLASFRDADLKLARSIAAEAEVGELLFSDLSAREAAQLEVVLRRRFGSE